MSIHVCRKRTSILKACEHDKGHDSSPSGHGDDVGLGFAIASNTGDIDFRIALLLDFLLSSCVPMISKEFLFLQRLLKDLHSFSD